MDGQQHQGESNLERKLAFLVKSLNLSKATLRILLLAVYSRCCRSTCCFLDSFCGGEKPINLIHIVTKYIFAKKKIDWKSTSCCLSLE